MASYLKEYKGIPSELRKMSFYKPGSDVFFQILNLKYRTVVASLFSCLFFFMSIIAMILIGPKF